MSLLKNFLTRNSPPQLSATGLPPAPFIVGVPRSGTTLLRLMCDAHPELSIPPEMGFMPAAASLRRRQRDALQQEFLDLVTGMQSWEDANIQRVEFERALRKLEPFTITEGVRTFYRAYAWRFDKPRWGDKTPSYCLHMREIEKIVPEAHFIHIIRDGRDVALSLRGLWFSPGDRIEQLAHHWRSWIETARRSGKRRRHYMEVRYEQLIDDAPVVLRKVCDFIGLTYDARMEKYYESSAKRLDEVKSMYRQDGSLVITKEERLYNQRFTLRPPEPSRVFRWRSEMDAETRSRFEAIAGDLLEELGYPMV
jgi:hypothetical protein